MPSYNKETVVACAANAEAGKEGAEGITEDEEEEAVAGGGNGEG